MVAISKAHAAYAVSGRMAIPTGVLRLLLGCMTLMSLCIFLTATGCTESEGCSASFYIRGTALDAESKAAALDAAVAALTFTNEVQTGYEPARVPEDGTGAFPSNDGTFEIVFGTGDQYPCPWNGPVSFPVPDLIEFVTVRNGCVFRALIEVTADTVVDPTAPDDVLELKEPILVPPCAP